MKLKQILISLILLSSVFLPAFNVTAYDATVTDFDRIWYSQTNGFNKNNDGALVLAVTYTDYTLRTIDSCNIEFNQDPFYFSITFNDELERDMEGNIIEDEDGYFCLRKELVMNYFPEDLRRLASKNLNYKTIEYNGDTWFRLHVPSFNQQYEWGTYNDPEVNEKWYTWGNNESIRLHERAMYIEKIKDALGSVEFSFTHPSDNSGQQVSISKSYLTDKGIMNPVFEHCNGLQSRRISYIENETHFLIDPDHFSRIGIHESDTGMTYAYITNDTHSLSGNTVIGYFNSYDIGDKWYWEPTYMQDGNPDTYSAQNGSNQVDYEKLTAHNLTNPIGSSNIEIESVELRYKYQMGASGSTNQKIGLYPYFNGTIQGDYPYALEETSLHNSGPDWSDWVEITDDDDAPTEWNWTNVNDLDVRVRGYNYLKETDGPRVSIVQIRVTYAPRVMNVSRSSSLTTETIQNCDPSENPSSFTPSGNWEDNVTLVYPLSSSVSTINSVKNNTCGTIANEVSAMDDLVNNTYWYDSTNQFVYIRTINLSTGTTVNWTVNASSGTTFNINFPSYVESGELCFIHGKITDAEGDDVSGVSVNTHLYKDGVDQINPVEWNCTGGNVQASFYANVEPGVYSISMEFEDEGLTYKEGSTLYVSTDPPSGSYVPALLHFSYYDSDTGFGLPQEEFKLFVSEDTSIDSSDRIYRDYYEDTYTGQTLYYRVDDYFDNQIYPSSGDYETLNVSAVNQWENIPIDWHSFSVKNMNHSIVHFKLTNDSTTYSQYLYPYEPFYWNVLDGEYTINLTYYNTATDAIEGYSEENITINNDRYYWIRGYDLQDIIIEVTAVNTSIDDLSIDISAGVDLTDSSVENISIRMLSNITATETNITNLILSQNSNISLIDAIVGSINTTMRSTLNVVNSTIDTVNNKIDIDLSFLESNITNLNNYILSNITAMNTTINTINGNVDMSISAVNSNVDSVETNIKSTIDLTETNLTSLNTNIWAALNITDSVVDYLNTTVHVEIERVNTTINYINDTVWQNFTLINKTVNDSTINIISNIDLTEQNLSSLNLNIWSNLNLTDSIVEYLNTSIWQNFSVMNTTINTINNKLDIDFGLLNTTVDYINNSIWTEFSTVNSNIDTLENNIDTTITVFESNITNLNTAMWNIINISNSTVTYLNNSIWSEFNTVNSNIDTIEVNLKNSLSLAETNITTLNNNIWNSINITDSVVDYLNNTLWGELNAINVTIDNLNNTMQSNFSMINSTLNDVNITVSGEVNIDDSNITNMISNVWGNLNITNSTLRYMNTSIWGEFTVTNSNIDDTQISVSGVWNDQNSSFMNLENRSTVVFNFYNTNEGLGLDRETLKVYVNGSRLTGNLYYCDNETDTINVTIKDYYNTTLFHQDFTISEDYRFLDLGITFHSWLFGNKNEEYYMISILKKNATRWWERGIVPNGEREFMIPSGNYTLRIYDADYDEIYNTSGINVTNSRVYTIEGSNLSEVISGQSVIRGQLLELRDDFDYALTPDATYYNYNPTVVFSVFDKKGMLLGNDIWSICPPFHTVATTYNNTYAQNTTLNALIPGNGTQNGTITVEQDILYFSGTSDYVNISYTNGTLIQNTSYVPNKVNINGGNITINASANISILRETVYGQVKKFDWDVYNSSTNPGHISGRGGYHTAGITVSNPLSVPIYDVYVFAAFTDKTNPDVNTVRVYDVANGAVLESGDGYKTTEDGIDFKITGGLRSGEDREYTLSYYSDQTTTSTYKDVMLHARSYQEDKPFNDEYYNYAEVRWSNTGSETFLGGFRVKLDFSMTIDKDSVVVEDLDNSQLVDSSEFIVGDEFIWIGNNAIGSISPGGTRGFGFYFQEELYPGQNTKELHLNTEIFSFLGLSWTPFLIIFLLSCIPIGLGAVWIVKKGRIKTSYLAPIVLGVFIMLTFYILQAKGV